MFIIPKKWIFDRESREPRFSEASVYCKYASHNGESHLVVKKINEKISVTLSFGDGEEHYMTGTSIFASSNETDAIKAVEEAAIIGKIAKREK